MSPIRGSPEPSSTAQSHGECRSERWSDFDWSELTPSRAVLALRTEAEQWHSAAVGEDEVSEGLEEGREDEW